MSADNRKPAVFICDSGMTPATPESLNTFQVLLTVEFHESRPVGSGALPSAGTHEQSQKLGSVGLV